MTGLLWIAAPAGLAAQLIALGKILDFVAGVPPWIGVLIGAAVMTAYFTAGAYSLPRGSTWCSSWSSWWASRSPYRGPWQTLEAGVQWSRLARPPQTI